MTLTAEILSKVRFGQLEIHRQPCQGSLAGNERIILAYIERKYGDASAVTNHNVMLD
jgi:hypothetical protein